MAGDPPPIPGALVMNPELQRRREEIMHLLNCGTQFPGAQPVSFARHHIRTLTEQDYFVCEKSDGVRLLLFCTETDDGREASFLIDRKNAYYAIPRLHFPLPNDKTCKTFHKDTVVDGELVLDIVDGQKKLVFLTFDLLLYQGQDIRSRDLAGRLGKLRHLFLEPMEKFLKANPDHRRRFPFSVEFKYMQLAYGIDMMYREVIPNLHHGNDGLIFTSQRAPYTSGTDETLLKWKPAHENSVDFRLALQFKVKVDGEPDYAAIPNLGLFAYHGGRNRDEYQFYSELYVDQKDWENLKDAGIRYGGLDGQVVECRLDELGRWRFMRIRDDKQHGNHISVVASVMDSIRDGVTMQELSAASFEFRKQYKRRHPENIKQ